MTDFERLKAKADQAFKMTPERYGLTYGELETLLNQAVGAQWRFDSVVTAYHLGFLRGHLATARGRIKPEKKSGGG